MSLSDATEPAGDPGMTHKVRVWIAAAVTAIFLGAVSVAGLIAQTHRPAPAATPVTQAAPGRARSINHSIPAPTRHDQQEHD
jgi:hypothetical protein